MAMDRTSNRFYLHRKEIQEISKRENVDVTIAARMLASDKNWTGCIAELNAWDQECIKYARDKKLTLADLFE